MIRAASARRSLLRPGLISAANVRNSLVRPVPDKCLGATATIARFFVTVRPLPSSSSTRLPATLPPQWHGRGHTPTAMTPAAWRSNISARTMAGSASSSQKQKATSSSADADSAGDSAELVLTPGEKVVVGTRLVFWGGALCFASVCAYYIGKELLPTKMSPNAIFDRASDVVRRHDEVRRRFGDPLKTYGRDHGGHREGRRNFIEHTDYVDAEDGGKRTRVRFNLEGPYGSAFVFAEVAKDVDGFVYVMVQDKRNGAVITVEDQRSALLAKRMAGGSEEGQSVFGALLGGGGGGGGQK